MYGGGDCVGRLSECALCFLGQDYLHKHTEGIEYKSYANNHVRGNDITSLETCIYLFR